MIIKAYEHEKIKKINNKIFLFYGENNGYKNQVVQEVFFEKFKGSIERYEENEILNNYDNFISGLTNKSFFEEKINTGKYYFDKILPRAESHYIAGITGSESTMKANFN